jgi:hypothetical protein
MANNNRTTFVLLLTIAFLTGALATSLLNQWTHPATVHADSTPAVYQFSNVGPATSLTMYSQSDHAIYVYQGALVGSNKVSCTFKYLIKEAGEPLNRQPCPLATIN